MNTSARKSQDHSLNSNIFEAFIYNFLVSFLICNNVTPIEDDSGRGLQAASPDEVSLVKFAEKMGFLLVERKLYEITIQTPSNEILKYEIIRNFPFSSERKV